MIVHSLKVGGVRYKINYIPGLCGDRKLMGRISHSGAETQIEAEMDDQAKQQTILHEALHAVATQGGRPDIEEAIIDSFAYGMLQIIRDNPKLIKWIQETR